MGPEYFADVTGVFGRVDGERTPLELLVSRLQRMAHASYMLRDHPGGMHRCGAGAVPVEFSVWSDAVDATSGLRRVHLSSLGTEAGTKKLFAAKPRELGAGQFLRLPRKLRSDSQPVPFATLRVLADQVKWATHYDQVQRALSLLQEGLDARNWKGVVDVHSVAEAWAAGLGEVGLE